jgi:hypothetical protein
LQDFYYTKAKLTSIIDNNINRYNLFGSMCLGIGSDKLLCFSIPWDDGAGKRVRGAKKRSAVGSPSLSCRNVMTIPQEMTCKWVHIRASIDCAVTLLDVKNRE